MAEKKPARVKKAVPHGKPIGLTSAIGPKATTALVICVIAGGIMVGARQQEAKRKNPPSTAIVEMAPLPSEKRAATAKKMLTENAAPAASPVAATVAGSAPATSATKAARATVVGCLEDDGAAFRLTGTTGADAPKARSWKSGFLKKGAAPVKLVGSSKALNLANHVGRRVAVTGTLANREMQAHAVQRVAGSCKAS